MIKSTGAAHNGCFFSIIGGELSQENGFEGVKGVLCPPQNIHFPLTSGGTLSLAHYDACSTLPACALLTELRNWDGIKAIINYARLPSASEETKVFASLMPLEVLNFNPAHEGGALVDPFLEP